MYCSDDVIVFPNNAKVQGAKLLYQKCEIGYKMEAMTHALRHGFFKHGTNVQLAQCRVSWVTRMTSWFFQNGI